MKDGSDGGDYEIESHIISSSNYLIPGQLRPDIWWLSNGAWAPAMEYCDVKQLETNICSVLPSPRNQTLSVLTGS